MDINKYFDELAIQLNKNGFVSQKEGDHLVIYAFDKELCEATETGVIRYKKEVGCDELLRESLDRVTEVCATVNEYVILLCDPENKQQIKDQTVLAKYSDTVLVGKPSKHGTEFVTWQLDADGDPYCGHYFTDYPAAKKDFAIRSGLFSQTEVFTKIQLAELYRAATETLRAGEYFLTADQSKALTSALEKIEAIVPDLDNVPKTISEQDIKDGIKNGVVKFIMDPNSGGGTVCQIGEYWFYFGGDDTEEMAPEEYLGKTSMDDVVHTVVEVLADFAEQEETLAKYNYYKAVLGEAKA